MVWHYSRHTFHFYLCYFKFLFIFIYSFLGLHWILVATRRPSMVAASGGYSLVSEDTLLLPVASLFEVLRPQSLDSVPVTHGLSCPAACGLFPGQGSNLCPLHWLADS